MVFAGEKADESDVKRWIVSEEEWKQVNNKHCMLQMLQAVRKHFGIEADLASAYGFVPCAGSWVFNPFREAWVAWRARRGTISFGKVPSWG